MINKYNASKRFLNRKAKPVMIASGVLFIISLIGVLAISSTPAQIKQQTTLVSYQQQGTFDYLAYLKPSDLFGPVPQPTPVPYKYPVALVDSIDFTFQYSPAAIGNYSVTVDAVLENPGIWQKSLPLASASSSGNLSLPFTLDIDQVQTLFDNIEKEIGINGQQRNVSINATVQAHGQTFVQSLALDINNGLIEINNSSLQQANDIGTGTIEYVVKPETSITTTTKNPEYPAAIADQINFDYSYTGLGATTPSTVSIDALLENPGVWQKTVPLVRDTQEVGDASVSFVINLNAINQQFDTIEKAIDIAPGTRDVTIIATTNSGPENFIQKLPITLNSTVIQVGSDLIEKQSAWAGRFDYSVHLTDDSLFGTNLLTPPTASVSQLPVTLGADSLHSPAIQPQSPPVTVGPGKEIFAKLLDRMNLSYNYQFQASQPVSNQMEDVNLTATINAPQAWTKTMVLLQNHQQGNFKLDIPLDMPGLINLMQNINSETGFSPGAYDITITANVHTTGDTKFGKIDDIYAQDMTGSLKGGILQWDNGLAKVQQGSISTTQTINNNNKYLGLSRSVAETTAIVFAFIFLILSVLAGSLYLRNKPSPVSREVNKEVQQIRKKYASRIVEAGGGGSMIQPADSTDIIKVNSIDDLLKVADELGKPVVHRASSDIDASHVFEILDNNIKYQYWVSPDVEKASIEEHQGE